MLVKNYRFTPNLLIGFISFVFIFSIFSSSFTKAQSSYSVHYDESKKYDSLGILTEKEWDEYNNFIPNQQKKKKSGTFTLQKEVFGWHPYWQGSSYLNYDYSLLTELSYFSYEVEAATGNAVTMREWETTPLVDEAQSHGVRVSLTVTLFSNHELFLTNQTAITTLIDNLIEAINARDADGVNIDFEAIPASQGENFTIMKRYV